MKEIFRTMMKIGMMKYIVAIVSLFICCTCVCAQNADFDKVYNACLLAQSSVNREVSNNEVRDAYNLLKEAKWSFLILQGINTDNEVELDSSNMVFSLDYLAKYIENPRLAAQKAKQYAQEEEFNVTKRGAEVQLCTKCIKPGKSVTYGIRHLSTPLQVAVVSEVNGLMNLSVTVKNKNIQDTTYKDISNEFKGTPSRKLGPFVMPEGTSDVYITIENKYSKPRSVAIILQ